MRPMLALALLLAGCGSQPKAVDDSPGARLEAAAEQAGLVVDPARASIVGSWALDTDRACVVPDTRDAYRIGVVIDYGEGQGCVASGSARRQGNSVAIAFGSCAFDAKFDGERITFPPELPAACERLCTGRASLAAMSVARLSGSLSEAETLRTPSGIRLCASGE
jgi:hypothetical protein